MSATGTNPITATILIVDDDLAVATSLRLAVERKLPAVRVLTAGHGEEGLDILRCSRVDLLVTDLRMPVLDGIALLSHVMEEFPQLPRVVMSSLGSMPKEHAARTGVLAVLDKPVNMVQFPALVEEWLKEARPHAQVEGISLSSLVQLVGFDRRTCTMGVRDLRTSRIGAFHFREGRLVDASAGDLHGMDAALFLLRWRQVQIWLYEGVSPEGDRIGMGLDRLLLEAARLSDEDSAGGEDAAAQRVPTPEMLRESRPREVVVQTPPPKPPPPPVPKRPRPLNELIDQAMDAFRAKNYPLAQELWEEAHQQAPDHAMINHNLRLVERYLPNQ